MTIKNANEAAEIIKEFLSRMGWSIWLKPRKAEKINGKWIIEFQVGLDEMRFELKSDTGEILRYETLK